MTLTPTVYHGGFVHTPKLGELQICRAGSIAVNAEGVIEWVATSRRSLSAAEAEAG